MSELLDWNAKIIAEFRANEAVRVRGGDLVLVTCGRR
jgi:hypothetical protein